MSGISSYNPNTTPSATPSARRASAPEAFIKRFHSLNPRRASTSGTPEAQTAATANKVDTGKISEQLKNIGREVATLSTGQSVVRRQLRSQFPVDSEKLAEKAQNLSRVRQNIQQELTTITESLSQIDSPSKRGELQGKAHQLTAQLQAIKNEQAHLESVLSNPQLPRLIEARNHVIKISASNLPPNEKAEILSAVYNTHKDAFDALKSEPVASQTLHMLLHSLQECKPHAQVTINEIRTQIQTIAQSRQKDITLSPIPSPPQTKSARAYLQNLQATTTVTPETQFFSSKFASFLLHPRVTNQAHMVEHIASQLLAVQSDMQTRMDALARGATNPSKEFSSIEEEIQAYTTAIKKLESELISIQASLINRDASTTKSELVGFTSRWQAQINQMKGQLEVLQDLGNADALALAQASNTMQKHLTTAERNPLQAGLEVHEALITARKTANKPVPDHITRSLETVERQARQLLQPSLREEALERSLLRGEKEIEDVDQKLLISLLSKKMTQDRFLQPSPNVTADLHRLLELLTPEHTRALVSKNPSFSALMTGYKSLHYAPQDASVAHAFRTEFGESLCTVHRQTTELTKSTDQSVLSTFGLKLPATSEKTPEETKTSIETTLTALGQAEQTLSKRLSTSQSIMECAMIQNELNALLADKERLTVLQAQKPTISSLMQQIDALESELIVLSVLKKTADPAIQQHSTTLQGQLEDTKTALNSARMNHKEKKAATDRLSSIEKVLSNTPPNFSETELEILRGLEMISAGSVDQATKNKAFPMYTKAANLSNEQLIDFYNRLAIRDLQATNPPVVSAARVAIAIWNQVGREVTSTNKHDDAMAFIKNDPSVRLLRLADHAREKYGESPRALQQRVEDLNTKLNEAKAGITTLTSGMEKIFPDADLSRLGREVRDAFGTDEYPNKLKNFTEKVLSLSKARAGTLAAPGLSNTAQGKELALLNEMKQKIPAYNTVQYPNIEAILAQMKMPAMRDVPLALTEDLAKAQQKANQS